MRSLTLEPIGITTSVLGLGCAPILGSVGPSRALKALENAYDVGVRHFDLARSYGFGEAEAFFGKFARGKRHSLTITTKFGILPSRKASQLARFKPVIWGLLKIAPGLRVHIRSSVGNFTMGGCFELETVKQSIEMSLRELGTDYIDFLLMHDCRQGSFDPKEMQELAAELKRAGKIRAFGIATSINETIAILSAGEPAVDLVQFPDNFLAQAAQHLPTRPQIAVIRHSPFRFDLETADQRAIVSIRRLLAEAAFDSSDLAVWHEIALALALRANPLGVVVCSMYEPRHIARNAKIADGALFPKTLLAAIETILPCGSTVAKS